jgi:hypothetical protein
MAPFDDYQDEMERLTSEQIEALLAGEDHSLGPVATLIRDVRVVLLEEPPPEVAARHLTAMAEAATSSWEPVRPTPIAPVRALPRRRGAPVLLAAALLLVTGIAAAVTLPNLPAPPEQDTVDTVAPSLAPQPSLGSVPGSSAEGTHGQEVSDVARNSGLTGCEKGKAVSAVASAKAAEHRQNEAEKNEPCAAADSQGSEKSGRPDEIPAGPNGAAGDRGGAQGAGGPKQKTGPNLGSSADNVGRSDRAEAPGRPAQGGGPAEEAPPP